MNGRWINTGGRIAAVAGACGLALLSGPPPASTAGGPPEFVDVIVQYDSQPGQSQRAHANAHGGQIKREFEHLPMLALRVPVNALHGLAQGHGVRTISLDQPVESFSTSARATARVPGPDSLTYVTPASDVRVAVLDSGVSSEHWDIDLTTTVDIIPAYPGGGNVRDDFHTYSFGGNDGTFSWNTPWQEYG